MVKRVITTIVCDLTGEEGARTTTFALNGHSYEIDLAEGPAQALADALAPYIGAAQSDGGPRRARSGSRSGAGRDPERAQYLEGLRAWAVGAGVKVPSRGRLPRSVEEAYAAHVAGK